MDQYRMIDGKDFANFVSGFVSFIRKTLHYTLTALKENYKTAILVFVVTASVGLFCRHNSKIFYEAVMVCTFREMNKKTYGEMVHNLDILAKDHSYNALAGQLNIPIQEAQQIISIEGKNMAGSMLFEDITSDNSPMHFDVKATKNTLFSTLQPALLNYLNTGSQYVNNKIKADSVDVDAKIQYLSKNIHSADSMITTAYSLKAPVTVPSDTLNILNFSTLFKYKVEMEAEMINQKRRQVDIKRPVEILHGFIPPDEPSSNKEKILRLTVIASLILPAGTAVLRKGYHDGTNLRSI